MSKEGKVIHFFHRKFRQVSRPHRELILCAMIRINYGTPWSGDEEVLKNFFPMWYHKNLSLGGLTHLIEALSPFTEEVTESGISADFIKAPDVFEDTLEMTDVVTHEEEVTRDIFIDTKTFQTKA